jgi:hypothetical protein
VKLGRGHPRRAGKFTEPTTANPEFSVVPFTVLVWLVCAAMVVTVWVNCVYWSGMPQTSSVVVPCPCPPALQILVLPPAFNLFLSGCFMLHASRSSPALSLSATFFSNVNGFSLFFSQNCLLRVHVHPVSLPHSLIHRLLCFLPHRPLSTVAATRQIYVRIPPTMNLFWIGSLFKPRHHCCGSLLWLAEVRNALLWFL